MKNGARPSTHGVICCASMVFFALRNRRKKPPFYGPFFHQSDAHELRGTASL